MYTTFSDVRDLSLSVTVAATGIPSHVLTNLETAGLHM